MFGSPDNARFLTDGIWKIAALGVQRAKVPDDVFSKLLMRCILVNKNELTKLTPMDLSQWPQEHRGNETYEWTLLQNLRRGGLV